MKHTIRTAVTAICIFAVATSALAFVKDPNASPKDFRPEDTQQQVAEQQNFNGQYGAIGDEQLRQPKTATGQSRDTDSSSAASVIMESNPEAQLQAAAIVKDADAQVTGKAGPGAAKIALWAFVLIAIGAAAVYAFKAYADKVVPAPTKRTVKW